MHDGTDETSTAVAEAPICPTWCTGAHLSDPGRTEDFHHGGAKKKLTPASQAGAEGGRSVAVSASALVDKAGTTHPACVELSIGDTTTRLSPVEAFSLGDSVSMAAQAILTRLPRPAVVVAEPRPVPEVEEIRHPVWCVHVSEDAPLAGDPLGSATYYDRLGPAEDDGQHVGREYRLDIGEGFAYSVSAAQVAMHDQANPGERVRLSVTNQEQVDASTASYMSAAQAREVARMLLRVADQQDSMGTAGRG